MFWIILIAVVGVGVILGVKQAQRNKELYESGKMTKRNYTITDEAEEFTLVGADFSNVSRAIDSYNFADYRISVSPNKGNQSFTFVCKTWQAGLRQKNDADGKNIWYFSFMNWKEDRYGLPEDVTEMNILVTGIEKIFLSIDPNTEVKNTPIQTKTKTKFF